MVKLNKNQQVSLLRKWKQEDNGLTFIGFRRTVQSTFGMDGAVVVPWGSMWLAIETDGYVHS
jgi:hypothetical protein